MTIYVCAPPACMDDDNECSSAVLDTLQLFFPALYLRGHCSRVAVFLELWYSDIHELICLQMIVAHSSMSSSPLARIQCCWWPKSTARHQRWRKTLAPHFFQMLSFVFCMRDICLHSPFFHTCSSLSLSFGFNLFSFVSISFFFLLVCTLFLRGKWYVLFFSLCVCRLVCMFISRSVNATVVGWMGPCRRLRISNVSGGCLWTCLVRLQPNF